MGIDPLGAAAVRGIYTKHIEIEPPASETTLHTSLESLLDSIEKSEGPNVIELGDLVTISFADAPGKLLRYRLYDGPNQPDKGLINVNEPLAKALIGASEEDEITLQVGNTERQVLVNSIDKRPTLAVAIEGSSIDVSGPYKY
jgi:hypothetical protein